MAKPKLYTSEAWLKQQYQIEHRTVEDIAKQCGVAVNTIRNNLNKFGLIR